MVETVGLEGDLARDSCRHLSEPPSETQIRDPLGDVAENHLVVNGSMCASRKTKSGREAHRRGNRKLLK
jgi:hypothetical protein